MGARYDRSDRKKNDDTTPFENLKWVISHIVAEIKDLVNMVLSLMTNGACSSQTRKVGPWENALVGNDQVGCIEAVSKL